MARVWIKPAQASYDPDEEKIFDATRWIGRAVLTFAVVGLVALLILSFGEARAAGSRWTVLFRNFGFYGLIACAAAAAGALFGFLFAIPRTREAATVAGRTDDPAAMKQAVLVANTNLERVSDWLVTLLLGATLVQIKPIVDWISALGTCTVSCSVTPLLVIFYAVLGFLGTYLITRLYLTYALERTLSMLGVLPGTSTDEIQKQLTDAIASGDKDKLDQALNAFDKQKSKEIADNPRLNLLVARAASRRIAAEPNIDAKRKDELQKKAVAAVRKASADATIKGEAKVTPASDDFQKFDAAAKAEIENLLR